MLKSKKECRYAFYSKNFSMVFLCQSIGGLTPEHSQNISGSSFNWLDVCTSLHPILVKKKKKVTMQKSMLYQMSSRN